MGKTGIEWTDETWNPVQGCDEVSPGCANCYARTMAGRIVAMGKGKPTKYDGLVEIKPRRQIQVDGPGARTNGTRAYWTGVVGFDTKVLAEPLKRRKPTTYFVNSMSDLFHVGFTDEQIAAVFGVMAACPQHRFILLTKRAERMRQWFECLDESVEEDAQESAGIDCSMSIHDARTEERAFTLMHHAANELGDGSDGDQESWYNALLSKIDQQNLSWPLPNVILGVSAENQATADERIPHLLATPAAVRMVSAEPLLGPLDLRAYLGGIDWVIAGCESGRGARPCEVDWLRSLAVQCKEAGVAFFLKQAFLGCGITCGNGSKRKSGGVVGLPYLDELQYKEFPR